MNKKSILRVIATVLVLCSLVLPLSRCEQQSFALMGDGSADVEKSQPVVYEYKYATDWFGLKSWEGWLVLLSFSWPPIMLLIRWRSGKTRGSKVLPWLEVWLCLGSGYVIWSISSFGERLAGAYVAMSGMGLYLITAGNELIQKLARRGKQA